MRPDLNYYHNPLLFLKNFLYFHEKNLANFLTPSPKKNKIKYPKKIAHIFQTNKQKKILYFGMNTDQVQNFLCVPFTLG